jgi:Na+/proline symporter
MTTALFLLLVIAVVACTATASHAGQVGNVFQLVDEMNEMNDLGDPVYMSFLSIGNYESVAYLFPSFVQPKVFATTTEVEAW